MNPQLTRTFAQALASKQEPETVTIQVHGQPLKLVISPGVFPPQQNDFSISSKSVYETFGDLTGEDVLDLGCGCGIAALVAARCGARHVDAVDIGPEAVACTQHNIALNNLESTITTWQSDLLVAVPTKQYDRIIANLPIVDDMGDLQIPVFIRQSLYDPQWQLHRRLLKDARAFLKGKRLIVFTHANLQSRDTQDPDSDFARLEQLIAEHGYRVVSKTPRPGLGFTWINYEITP